MLRLFLAFTLIPALELYLLILIGQWLGPVATVLIIVTTGAVGAWLAKREGLSVLKQISEEARRGFPSGDRIVEGLMVLVAGVLLVTPGVLTDITGFVLVAPSTRKRIAPHLKRYLMKRFVGVTGTTVRFGSRDVAPPPSSEPDEQDAETENPFDHPTA